MKANRGFRRRIWRASMAARFSLRDGRVVTADDAYIRESILEPDKRVVAGYEPLMPSFEGLVGDDEILRLTAFIRSLKDKGRAG